MKRPLWLIGISFLLSIRVAFIFSSFAAFLISITFLLLALGCLILKRKNLNSVLVVLFTISIGFASVAYYSASKVEPFEAYKSQLIKVEGIVEDVSMPSQRSVRYTVSASFPQTELPNSKIVVRDYISAQLSAGDSFSTVMEFGDPKYTTTKIYYERQGIPGEGVLIEDPIITDTLSKHKLKVQLIKYREYIYNKTNDIFSPDTAALVNSMCFGMAQDIDSGDYSNLNRSGISHLISVSGLHLSIFAGFILKLASLFKVNKKLRYILTIISSCIFSVFIGLSPAIIRALIMTVTYLFGKIINQKSDSLNSMGLSAIIIGIIWPQWTLSIGLWLSFLASAGIIISGSRLSRKLYTKFKHENSILYNKFIFILSSSIGASLGAYIFTLPVLIFNFGWVSLSSPLANLLVAPFALIIILFGIAIVLLPAGFPFAPLFVYVVEFSSKMILESSKILSRVSFSTFSFNHILLIIAIILVMAIILLSFIKKDRILNYSTLALAVLLILASSSFAANADTANHYLVTSLPDNQLVISKGNNAVVFMKSDRYSIKFVSDYLDYSQINNIDTLIVLDYKGVYTDLFKNFSDNYVIKSVIGPSDDYSLEMLSKSLSGIQIYSAENAVLKTFNNLTIDLSDKDNVNISLNNQKILLSSQKYDIMCKYDSYTIYFLDGTHILPKKTKYKIDLLGERIYKSKTIKL